MIRTNVDFSNVGCLGIVILVLLSVVLWAVATCLVGSLLWLVWSGLAPVAGWPTIEYTPFLAGFILVGLVVDVAKALLK